MQIAQSNVGWSTNCTASGRKDWRVFSLFNQGVAIVANLRRMPTTAAMLDSLQSRLADCALGNAFVSSLPCDTRIAAHRGPTNARLRCHLPLVAPRTCQRAGECDCAIRIDGRRVHWHAGELMLFDDSLVHEVDYTAMCEKHEGQVVNARF